MTSETPPPPTANAPRWRALLLLLVVFFIGAACGLGGGALVLRQVMQRAIQGELSEGKAPADWVIGTLEKELADDLDLTVTERAAVHQELMSTAHEFRQMRVKMIADTRERVRETLARVAKLLPEEKRALLEERASQRLRPWGLIRKESTH